MKKRFEKLSTIKIIINTILLSTAFGTVSLLFNYQKIINQFGALGKGLLISFIATLAMSIFSEFCFCLITTLIFYFFLAAIGKGVQIKKLWKRGAIVSLGLPLINLINCILIIITGTTDIGLGSWNIIVYIPFLIFGGLLFWKISCDLLENNKNQCIALTAIGIIFFIISVWKG